MEQPQLAWRYGKPAATAQIRQQPADFVVTEDLGFSPDGAGEHLFVRLRKTGCTTPFIAERLARFAGIARRAVSYAGMKDRHAVTEQWFSLHLPGKASPAFDSFNEAGCEVLQVARHSRKLRIGALQGNQFRLVLRQVSGDRVELETRLQAIAAQGAPNYFGEQRFGRSGQNLSLARRWASGEITIRDRQRRSFALSAARSLLFNLIVSQRLENGTAQRLLNGDVVQLAGRGSWFVAHEAEHDALQPRVDAGELLITALLAGDGAPGTVEEAAAFETACLSAYAGLVDLLRRERVTAARRAILVRPRDFTWRWSDEQTLHLAFWLPAGSFATTIIRELLNPVIPFDDSDENA